MRLGIALIPVAAVAVISVAATAAESICGFGDNETAEWCVFDMGHAFWATHPNHDEAHQGFHTEIDCGGCQEHRQCGSQAAAEIEEALDGARPLDVTLIAHARFIKLRENGRALDIMDCAGEAEVYAFRLNPKQVEIAREVLTSDISVSD